jgi:hypothetical protein
MIKLGYVYVYQLYAGPFGLVEMTLFLIDIRVQFFCRLSGCTLDTAMGLPSPSGSAGEYG